MVVPFMNQMPRLPLVSIHRMSAMLSPLKSPVPATDHWVGIELKLPACEMVVPFINHIPTLPLVSRQRTSANPSPLKSRWPTTDHCEGTELKTTPLSRVE